MLPLNETDWYLYVCANSGECLTVHIPSQFQSDLIQTTLDFPNPNILNTQNLLAQNRRNYPPPYGLRRRFFIEGWVRLLTFNHDHSQKISFNFSLLETYPKFWLDRAFNAIFPYYSAFNLGEHKKWEELLFSYLKLYRKRRDPKIYLPQLLLNILLSHVPWREQILRVCGFLPNAGPPKPYLLPPYYLNNNNDYLLSQEAAGYC